MTLVTPVISSSDTSAAGAGGRSASTAPDGPSPTWTATETGCPSTPCPRLGASAHPAPNTSVDALPTAGPVVALTRRADGTAIDDLADDGDVCPESWTHVGGRQFSIACHGAQTGAAIAIDTAPDGRTWSADTEAELCPEGWAHVGGRSSLAVCVSVGPVEVVWLDAPSSCPESHRWIGSAGGRAACAASVE